MSWASPGEIVRKLGGRWTGRRSRCTCPVKEHSTKHTLAVDKTQDGRVLVYCHAGCDQRALIDELRRLNLWGDGELVVDPSYPAHLTTKHDGSRSAEDRAAREAARAIWDGTKPARDTLVQSYLRGRGIMLPMPDQIRFSPRLVHSPSRKSFPAMVARIADENGFCAVQRTFLNATTGKKIEEYNGGDLLPAKMTKGPMGDGAVRLLPPSAGRLGLAEGIETALSAIMLYSVPVWATLSAHRLCSIQIPRDVRSIVIFADEGEVGKSKAFAAADRYEARGYDVEVIPPFAHYDGGRFKDFNDVLNCSAGDADREGPA